MAENQSINQEEAYWRRVVLRWVKCSQLNTGTGYNDLAACYNNFRCKIIDCHDLQERTVVDFLRVKFPHFELQQDQENEIPESDAIYVFSLMLYYSCVRHSIPYFQNVCKEFDVAYQHSMKAFLNSFVPDNDNTIVINRAFMDKAFQNAKQSATALSEKACNKQDHSVQMLTSTPISKQEMKKPSPPTPKSVALEWKVKNLNALLESAKTENITQERQIEQLLQNVKELQDENKRYQSKISVLQLKDTCACASSSVELSHPTNRLTAHLEKQIEANSKTIEELQEEVSKTKESAQTAMERYMELKKEYATVQEDNQRLKTAAEDLKEEITVRDNINQTLTESVNDLRRFIRENHIRGAELMEPLESSFEYLDKSFQHLPSDDSQCYDSENLASTVVDIKLKEKEHENEELTKKVQELEGKIEDMHKLHNDMLEQQQTDANAKITELQRSLAEAEEYKTKLAHELKSHKAENEELIGQLESEQVLHIAEQKRVNDKVISLKQRVQQEKVRAEELELRVEDLRGKMHEARDTLDEIHENKEQLINKLERAEARIDDLEYELKTQNAKNFEKRKHLQDVLQKEISELELRLMKSEESKANLAEKLSLEEAKSRDLNYELDMNRNLQADMSGQISGLLQTLADAEKCQAQITKEVKKGKAEIEDLNGQLKQQSEEIARLKTELIEKTTALQRRLDEAGEIKMHLEDDLKQTQTKTQGLHHEIEGMNELIVELRQTVSDAKKDKSQLSDSIEQGEARIADLIAQLESQNVQIKERERLLAEMNVKIKELQRCLDVAQESDSNLVAELKKEQAKTQNLARELDTQHNLQADMDEKIAALRQALADVEKEKTQLLVDLEQSKSKIAELIGQLDLQKKLQLEKSERLQVEMKEQKADMQQALAAAEQAESQLADELEKEKLERGNLICLFESVKVEMDLKLSDMRQALADAEKGKTQLLGELNNLKSNEGFAQSLRTEMREKISALEQSLEQEKEKSDEINCQYLQMKQRVDDFDEQCTKLMKKLADERTEITNLQKELAAKDVKLQELNEQYEEKRKQFEKSYQDNEILSVKLLKSRAALKEKDDAWTKSLQEAKKSMEEKLRDARVEFDSTMEKMKERMKELHKEIKSKLEFDNQGLALTAEGYRRKVDNLEIRCSKLQQQLAEMNERNLEVRKENQHLHIKLKTLEDFCNDRKSFMLPTQASLRSNLRMEDEEGELFNNMYLADLKSGRCVSPGPTNGGLDRYSELSQRNSKLLPHLRTNYVALAPDCEPPSHDDTRDTMSTTFDDSSTGLISRRKVSGITSYKRPGPPTPSKRAGRLSLNGALAGNGGEIQYKEALRDANANAGSGGASSGAEQTGTARTGRTKTPGKFKQMISSSSLLNNFQRDEGNTLAITRRVQQPVTDNSQHMPSKRPIRLTAVASRKRLQRKMLFDSNRCLDNGSVPRHQGCVAVPLGTILECPIPGENTPDENNVILSMTRTTSTLTDIATTTTTAPTHVTATHIEPMTVLSASDYSFKHPYGSNRYNILRMQGHRREKRRQLYDEPRKVATKGISSAVSEAPAVGVTAQKDKNYQDSTADITLYHSFSSDNEDSYKSPVSMYSTIATTYTTSVGVRCSALPLVLTVIASIGFLAQILFFLNSYPTTIHQPHDG